MRVLVFIALAPTALAVSANAKTVLGVSQATPEGSTISPQAGLSATNQVKLRADASNEMIGTANLASAKAQRGDVEALARQAPDDATTQQRSLAATLSNTDRKITRPAETLSSQRNANLVLLRKVPGFGSLYQTQQADGAPTIRALRKVYATGGTDRSLPRAAASAIPSIEREFATVRSLMPAGLAQSH